MDRDAASETSETLRRHAARIRETASEAYHAGRHSACAEACAELERVERSLGDPSGLAEARFWRGTALHGSGRLSEAIFVFGRSLDETELDIDDPWLYMTITRFLRAMVELPFPLAEILDAFEQVEQQLRESKQDARRSRLLLARARLALSRGRLRSALALGEESLARWRHESPSFTGSSHYWVVVTACLWLGDLPRARRHLDAWAALGEGGAMQRVFLACKRAELARREGELGRTLALARGAWIESAASEDHQRRIFAGHAYLRALLLAGRLEPARAVLAQLCRRLHRIEFAEHAFVLRALHADWQLARARLAAGLPMIDPECGIERRPRRPGPERAVAEPALARARRLYARALAQGHEVDRLLGTGLRRWEIEARLALCERTERELARR
jgi:tetratricopeptide (TPR) repeat protein